MANKKFLLGILATVLAFGMAVIGCDDGSGDDENTDPKKITITGITGVEGSWVMINLMDDQNTIVAAAQESMAEEITFSLKQENGTTDWTGTGSYLVILSIGSGQNSVNYLYTEGKSFEDLEIASEEDMAKLPKYNISNTTSIIGFDQFMQEPGGGN
jgi:hypothetical protein